MGPHILDLSNGWGGSFTTRPLYPRKENPGMHWELESSRTDPEDKKKKK